MGGATERLKTRICLTAKQILSDAWVFCILAHLHINGKTVLSILVGNGARVTRKEPSIVSAPPCNYGCKDCDRGNHELCSQPLACACGHQRQWPAKYRPSRGGKSRRSGAPPRRIRTIPKHIGQYRLPFPVISDAASQKPPRFPVRTTPESGGRVTLLLAILEQ